MLKSHEQALDILLIHMNLDTFLIKDLPPEGKSIVLFSKGSAKIYMFIGLNGVLGFYLLLPQQNPAHPN